MPRPKATVRSKALQIRLPEEMVDELRAITTLPGMKYREQGIVTKWIERLIRENIYSFRQEVLERNRSLSSLFEGGVENESSES